MRIGILTFHRAYNYGAFLQCYSLWKHLKNDIPSAQVEIIDYESKNMYNYYKTDLLSMLFGHSNHSYRLTLRQRLSKAKQFCRKLMNDKSYIKNIKVRNQRFEEALSYLDMSNEKLISDKYEEFKEFINSQKYDLIVVGSDAIWNDAQTCQPNIYYLGEDIKSNFISYAASSFGMDYTKKSKKELNEISNALKCFDYIGVRDKATEDYVKLLNVDKTINHNCDPSIILDLEKKEFNISRVIDMLKKGGIDFSKPIFGIMGGEWLGKIARDLVGENAQLIAVYEPNKYADMYVSDLSPFEWAKIFSLFTITFTHFFHGTLFSLKNGVPTMSIEWENEYSNKFDTKILDVLKRLELQDYRFTKEVAEIDMNSLRKHYNAVINNIELEKERIEIGLAKEQKTYRNFLNDIKSIMEI